MSLLLPLIVFAAGPVLLVLFSPSRIRPVNILTLISLSAFASAVWVDFSAAGEMEFRTIWFQAGGKSFGIILQAGETQQSLIVFTCLIGLLVTIWSGEYFGEAKKHTRFYHTLSLFMCSMTGLLLAGDLLLLFFFWELVGLCSYLLVGYYRESAEAGEASFAAMLTNKIGDAGFLVALMVAWSSAGTLDIKLLSASGIAGITGWCVLLAICSKSAQFPMHGWLPRAMAGPTPASALIHSATMVAAGVFLFWRLDFLFTAEIRWTAGALGLITALLGGWNALTQTSIKKVLAWSTLSQLGMMIMTAGWGKSSASLLHLQVHGLMKAGFFMLAGSLLLRLPENKTENELEAIGKSDSMNRFLTIALCGFSFGLAGLPLTSGFLSKEVMLQSLSPGWAMVGFFAVTLLTVAYTSRLMYFLTGRSSSGSISWREVVAIGIPMIGVLWLAAGPVPTKIYGNPNEGHLVIMLVSGAWVVMLFATAWGVRKTGIFDRAFRLVDTDRWSYPAVKHSTIFFAIWADRFDRKVIDRLVKLPAVAGVVAAHLVAFTDRWVVDGVVRLTGRATALTGTMIRKAGGRSAGSYLWWTFAGILILLFWQT